MIINFETSQGKFAFVDLWKEQVAINHLSWEFLYTSIFDYFVFGLNTKVKFTLIGIAKELTEKQWNKIVDSKVIKELVVQPISIDDTEPFLIKSKRKIYPNYCNKDFYDKTNSLETQSCQEYDFISLFFEALKSGKSLMKHLKINLETNSNWLLIKYEQKY